MKTSLTEVVRLTMRSRDAFSMSVTADRQTLLEMREHICKSCATDRRTIALHALTACTFGFACAYGMHLPLDMHLLLDMHLRDGGDAVTSGYDDIDFILQILHLDFLNEMHELAIKLMQFIDNAARIGSLSDQKII